MAYHSLLFVSKSLLPAANADAMVQQIVAASVAANGQAGLTGALIFTGSHFAQILEGGRAEIDRLMAVIRQDTRHSELRIFDRQSSARRRFSDWRMAYMGPSQFISRHILHLIENDQDWRASLWMYDLIAELSKAV